MADSQEVQTPTVVEEQQTPGEFSEGSRMRFMIWKYD